MNEIIRKIEAEQMKENAPEFNVGDTVKVYAKIKEGNRERIQVFEGDVYKRQLQFIQADEDPQHPLAVCWKIGQQKFDRL